MNTFKNNNRRSRFRSNGDRSFRKRNGNGHKNNGDFNSNPEFKRRNPGRNNQNASKLVEKYNDLAREALSNGDKILSENYLQHADHFSRIIKFQEDSKNIDQSNKPKQQVAPQENENKLDIESTEKKTEQQSILD